MFRFQKFEFLDNKDLVTPIFSPMDLNNVMERVKDLLNDGVGKDGIMDYLNVSVQIRKFYLSASSDLIHILSRYQFLLIFRATRIT